MYRIRSASGTEASYSSLEDFTAAVRRGEVAPEDEIYHSRANRWLDVKSHPHYRGAINWSGPLSADAIFSPTPAPAPAKPAANSAPASSHNGAAARLQVAEIPAVAKPAATVYRPQLAAEPQAHSAPQAPAAEPVAPAPPPQPRPVVKTRDLTYLDLDDPKPGPAVPPARQNATIIEARKPPAAPPGPAKPPTKESDFLVMDTGLERPTRSSNGQRAIAGDADMLFDTPVADTLPPSQAAVSVPPTPVTPAAAAPAASATPAAHGPAAAAPKPPAHPKPLEPPKAETRNVRMIEDDLDIPGRPLLHTPIVAVSPAVESRGRHASRGSLGLVIGSGAAIALAASALIFWRPWAGNAQGAESATAAQPTATPAVQGLPPFAGGTETTTAAGALAKPVPATSLPGGLGDSAGASEEEQVISARPSLHAEVPMPATDLDLGTDLAPTTGNTTVPPNELARRLEVAEKQARQELAARLGGFKGLLGAERLSSSTGAAQTQSAWNGGADAIRQYRAKIARLEQAYEDSVLTSQRTERWTGDALRGWATRQSLAEPGETSQMADLMLNQVDQGLGLLAGLEGQYEMRDGKIRFKNPASAPRYLSIRSWVVQRTESWSSTPEGARPHTVNLILRALGEGFPPME